MAEFNGSLNERVDVLLSQLDQLSSEDLSDEDMEAIQQTQHLLGDGQGDNNSQLPVIERKERSRISPLTADEIDELEPDDIVRAIELLEHYDLPTDGIDTVTQAQQVLRRHLAHQNMDTDKVQVLNVIENIMQADIKVKEQLQSLLVAMEKLLTRLPKERLAAVREIYPDVDKLTTYREQLASTNAVILVAGETGAGKSSLLNLLLGELGNDLMPVAHLSSTAVICEVKYGSQAKLVAYPKNQEESPITVSLEENPAATIAKYTYQDRSTKTSEVLYSKVEVFWPCQWLKGGISLVDSPGVGENDEMTKLVKTYIPRASAFIYVINTENAGGIQPDRLQDLLFSHLCELDEEYSESNFNPASAIFLCNKWDLIPQPERDEVEEVISKKLKSIWPQFQEEQVFFASVKQINENLKDTDYVSRQFKQILEGINRLIPIGMKAKLIPIYSSCVAIMERCLVELKYYINSHLVLDERLWELEQMSVVLEEVESRAHNLEKDSINKLDTYINDSVEDLEDHFNDKQVQNDLLTWQPNECPQFSELGFIANDIKLAWAEKRLKEAFDKWDEENQLFAKIQKLLTIDFYKDYADLEQSLNDIEAHMSSQQNTDNNFRRTFKDDLKPLPFEEKTNDLKVSNKDESPVDLATGPKSQIWVPLGFMMTKVSTHMQSVKAFFQGEKKLSASAIEERCKAMGMATQIILNKWLKKDHLHTIVDGQFTNMKNKFTKLVQTVLKRADSNKQMIERLIDRQEAESNVDQLDICTELYEDCELIRDQVNYLYLTQLHTSHFEQFDFTDNKCIGFDSFALVSKAKLRSQHKRQHQAVIVVLKRWKDAISKDNVTIFLKEADNLRRLKSAYVVTFYGIFLTHQDHKVFGTLVLEYCDRTLDQVIFSSGYPAPGRRPCTRYQAAKSAAAELAFQVFKGLKVMHDAGFLHRNLTPYTILVASDGRIKLAELGTATAVQDVTGSLIGPPLSTAPEVIRQERYTQSADIFSAGMLLWELWYGQTISSLNKKMSPLGSRSTVMQMWSSLAHPDEDHTKPEEPWMKLMQKCWSNSPEDRPSAYECMSVLHKYIIDNL